MGLISDNLELAYERTGRHPGFFTFRRFDNSESSETAPILPIKPPSFFCPIADCHESFLDEQDLKAHLFSKHTHRIAYLKVNGKIVSREAFVFEPIDSLSITTHGFSDGDIESIKIAKNGGYEINAPFNPNGDLISYVTQPNLQKIEITLKLFGASNPNRFVLHCHTRDGFESESIDEDVFQLLFDPLHKNRHPRLSDFSNRRLHGPLRPIERLYAEGFYDYAIAFDLILHGDRAKAKPKLEFALSRLSGFATNSAVTATRVLALKMNVFGRLLDALPPSIFASSNAFFNRQMIKIFRAAERMTLLSSEKGIFVDDFTHTLINGIQAFSAEDWTGIDSYLEKLRGFNDLDGNDYSKLKLLEARTAGIMGRESISMQLYQDLEDHPVFGPEAKQKLSARKNQ